MRQLRELGFWCVVVGRLAGEKTDPTQKRQQYEGFHGLRSLPLTTIGEKPPLYSESPFKNREAANRRRKLALSSDFDSYGIIDAILRPEQMIPPAAPTTMF